MQTEVNANMTSRRSPKKWIILLLTGAMLLSPVGGLMNMAHAAEDSIATAVVTPTLKKVSEEIITSGARLIHYQFTTTRSGKTVQANVNVIEADLTNPYLKLDTMTGKDGQLNTKQSVKGMTNDTGAVAGVNGDYYSMTLEGAPLGGAVSDGVMISSPSQLTGMYAFAVSKSGVPFIDEYEFEGTARGSLGEAFPLAGINKSTYMTEPDKSYSHVNAMYIYTDAWANTERPINSATTPTEVLVQDGFVTAFSDGASLDMAVPDGAYILRGHGTAAEYMRENMTIGSPVAVNYKLVSETTGEQLDPSSLQMMIGGHTLLVDNGEESSFTRDISSISGSSARARTAVGYSKDKRYAYIVTAEKNSSSSGLTLKELQQALIQAGVWKAVNLDGGGSTQMVHRPLAETSTVVTHDTEDGTTQRQVVNGIGIFTTAPQGDVKGMQLSGPSRLYIGQTANYSVKAYDQYYNPVDASSTAVNWSSSDSVLAWNGTSFTAKKAGTTQVIATTSSGAKNTKEIEVIGADQIDQLYIDASSAPLAAGSSVTLPVKVKLKDGSTGTLPNDSVEWEFTGFTGSVSNGVLKVESVADNTQVGYAFASYDGIKTMITLTDTAEQLVENFNGTALNPSFAGLPAETTFGDAALVANYDGRSGNDKVLKLSYDMTGDPANKFAYAVLNETAGVQLPDGTTSFKIDAYGDGSMNWMRAKLKDANGKEQLIDVAKVIDWTGWKTFEVDLTSLGASGPYTLERLYVVNLMEGQEGRSTIGEVAFDNIRATLPAGGDLALPQAEMKLTVNSKQVTVNGQSEQLDVAPIVLNGSTYVPVRVILDAFGGTAGWDNTAKKVSVLRGDNYLELTVNQQAYWNNGARTASEVSPIIQSGRTLVPLRLVSEQLGLVVDWDQQTKSITIR